MISPPRGFGQIVRFESSGLDAGKSTSLAEYVKRMATDQKEIYCLLRPIANRR